jgi:hypothetical protein
METKGSMKTEEVIATKVSANLLTERDWMVEYADIDGGLRYWLSRRGMERLCEIRKVYFAVESARDKAKHDAIKNLARYKFYNFGYHAARWVTLNRLLGDKQRNPFAAFVELARQQTAVPARTPVDSGHTKRGKGPDAL